MCRYDDMVNLRHLNDGELNMNLKKKFGTVQTSHPCLMHSLAATSPAGPAPMTATRIRRNG